MANITNIIPTLKFLSDSGSPLTISSPNIQDTFSSYILGINNNSLNIDQLMPANDQHQFQAGDDLDIRISHNDTDYRFYSKYLGQHLDEHKQPFHAISLPTQLHEVDKRSSYRIYLRLTERPKIFITNSPGKILHGALENISATGVLLRLEKPDIALKKNAPIQCRIELNTPQPLYCKALVKHYKKLPGERGTKIGIEFWQLDSQQTKELRKALMRFQRHSIRTDLTL